MATAAIVVAGGSGTRLGAPGGKQLVLLLGTPVVSWALKALDAVDDVALIVVVRPSERAAEFTEAVVSLALVTPVRFAESGPTRQESVVSGLAQIPEGFELVAIHDGARPLLVPETVAGAISLLEASPHADGVVVGHPSVDTVKFVDEGRITATPDRARVWMAQTPQILRMPAFRRAIESALQSGFVGTDDASVVEQFGGTLLMFDGPRDNIKITVAEDVVLAEAVLALRAGGS